MSLILDINCTYQMFAHRGCAILFTKITMFPYSEQVEDTVQVYWRQFEAKMN